MAPIELILVFKHLWPPLVWSSLSPDCPENYLLWVDLIWTFSIGLHADSPLELLRTVSALLFIVHILNTVHCDNYSSILFCNYLILHCLILLFNNVSQLLFWLLFNSLNYCSIIWHWKYIPGIPITKTHNKKTIPVIIKYSWVNKHHTTRDSPTFVLA